MTKKTIKITLMKGIKESFPIINNLMISNQI
jgi:hypothetical protein